MAKSTAPDLAGFPIQELPLSAFRRDPANTYTHTEADIERLAAVIREHGFLVPVTVDAESEQEGTYQLVGGEARIEGARRAGLATVPAVLAHFASPQQRAAAAIALNPQYGLFDDFKLAETLQQLVKDGMDLDAIGLPASQIDDLLASLEDELTLDHADFTGGYADDARYGGKDMEGEDGEDGEDDFDADPLREVVLRFEKSQHRTFVLQLRALQEHYGVAGLTLAAAEAIKREYERLPQAAQVGPADA